MGSNWKCGSDERSNVEFSLELPGMKTPRDTLLQARDFQGELYLAGSLDPRTWRCVLVLCLG